MADFSQIITNTLNVLAADTVSVWGTMEWGTDNWGSTGDVTVSVDKIVNVDASAITTQIDHAADFIRDFTNTTTLTSEVLLTSGKVISVGSTTITTALNQIYLIDTNGYYTVFRGDTTEGEDQINSSYNEVTGSDSTWYPVSEPSTDWS